jgi:hypothetical protein
MTVRARSVREAEARMPYLVPQEIYARINPCGSGSSIVLCSESALRANGMQTRMFISRERHGIHETEVMGIRFDHLVPDIGRILSCCQQRRDRRYRIEFFDGTAYTPLRWDEKLNQMQGGERQPERLDLAHIRAMARAYREVKLLVGKEKNVQVVPLAPWNA